MNVMEKIDRKYPGLYVELAIGYGLFIMVLAALHFLQVITLGNRLIAASTLFALGVAVVLMSQVIKK